jgi:hypothetical protein
MCVTLTHGGTLRRKNIHDATVFCALLVCPPDAVFAQAG